MRSKSPAQCYSAIAIGSHWTAAAAIIALLILGFAAANAEAEDETRAICAIEVVLGVMALTLMLFRAVGRLVDQHPEAIHGMTRWQRRLSQSVCMFLYALPIMAASSEIRLTIVSNATPILFFSAPDSLPKYLRFL